MENNKENDVFRYTYSAKMQEEINKIRKKYQPKELTKLEQLRKLDESATRPGMIAALTVGIAGLALFGLGLCCSTVWSASLFVPGILIGLVGMALMLAAYPLFTRITKKRREKLAPEILRLTDELSQQ